MLGKLKLSKTVLIILASLITGLAAIGASVYFYTRYQKALKQLQDPQLAGQEELSDVVNRISRYMDLPADEQPTLATVTDVSKLADQPFFAKAKNGDKVLIYNNARKAILYDPIRNKIMEVAPLNVATPSAQTATTSAPVKLALYNGTDVIGLTATLEQQLKNKGENPTILLRDNARKRNYDKTLVVDLTGTQSAQAKRIATLLNALAGMLPPDEIAPVLPTGQSADFLIIAGHDMIPTPTVLPTVTITPAG